MTLHEEELLARAENLMHEAAENAVGHSIPFDEALEKLHWVDGKLWWYNLTLFPDAAYEKRARAAWEEYQTY